MATVGEQLRRRRDQAGLTLSVVATRTRVPERILADIERDDFSHVPGGIYIRGYITSFARVVGLDGEKLWTEYLANSQPVPETTSPPPVTVPAVRRWSFVTAASVVTVVGVIAGLLRYNATRDHTDANVVQASEPLPLPTARTTPADVLTAPAPPPSTEAIAEPPVAVDAPAPEPPRRVPATRKARRASRSATPAVTASNEPQAPAAAPERTDAEPPADPQ